MIHTMKRKKGKKGYVVIKVDLEKAYDRVRWDVLQQSLEFVGVPQDLIALIMNCVWAKSMEIL